VRPPPTTPEMFPGLLGRLVAASVAATEADAVCVTAQFLVALSAVVGHGPRVCVGETIHCLNENLLVVGPTSNDAKGDGGNVALAPLLDAAQPWQPRSGLSSGEGLIHAVRDPVFAINAKGERVLRDEGVEDKRLLALATEFASLLRVLHRDGNTLSPVIRNAWDGKAVLETMTRNAPLRATGAHVAIVAHTTPEDLRAYLTTSDAADGFGNRFMMVLVRRCRLLPSPQPFPQAVRAELAHAAYDILEHAQSVAVLARTPAAEALWEWIYPVLKAERPGLVGKVLARAAAHTTRLAGLFALCARATAVDVPHVTAALRWWWFVTQSTTRIFADRSGNDGTDRIRTEMLPGEQMDLTTMRGKLWGGHVTSGAMRDAIKLAEELGYVRLDAEETGGRPRTVVTRLPDEPLDDPEGT
jgi:hypothetical protein